MEPSAALFPRAQCVAQHSFGEHYTTITGGAPAIQRECADLRRVVWRTLQELSGKHCESRTFDALVDVSEADPYGVSAAVIAERAALGL